MTTPAPDSPAELFELDRSMCIVLLATQHIGRLVIGGTEPTVVPVNYTIANGVITFRTAAGSGIDVTSPQPVVFEVDMFDERTHSGWSVVARGELRPVAADDHHADVESWAPGARDRWMVVPVTTATGRLLRGAVDAPRPGPGGYL
jgi:uncharacterized protein